MATLRVFELARKLKIPSKELLVKLGQLKIPAKSHLSGITEDQAKRIENAFKAQRAHKTMLKRAAELRTAKTAEPAARKKRKKPSPARPAEKETAAGKAAGRRDARRAKAPVSEEKQRALKERFAPLPEKKRLDRTRRKGRKSTAAREDKSAPDRSSRKKSATTLKTEDVVLPRELRAPSRMSKRRAKLRKAVRLADSTAARVEAEERARVEIDEVTTVEELADKLGLEVNALILEMMDHDILATKNQVLDVALARKIVADHGLETVVSTSVEELFTAEEENPELLEPRAPVITIMGHVDHGKTSLLDMIRKTNVTEDEAGGITQHIGASLVELEHGNIVFLDTPGHEAFTAMRARGAQVTDLVVLLVAADDGVKPQTLEAMAHARAAEVPIIVAINKIDKPGADVERVRMELNQQGMVPEEWGGTTVCMEISAKTGQGVPDLLEMLLVKAEELHLRANPHRMAHGTVIEGMLDRGRGAVGHILVLNGTLRVGDPFVAGLIHGRVRAMFTDKGEAIEEAMPATPVEVLGFSDVPTAGDVFIVLDDERKARRISEERQMRYRRREIAPVRAVSLEDFQEQFERGETEVLNLVIKADVQGSVDALLSGLDKLSGDKVRLQVLHSGVGGISESDVMLASASDAVILGFHVVAGAAAKRLISERGVDVRTYRVIYEATDDIRKAMEGMLKPLYREEAFGHADVKQTFRISKKMIAGCLVTDGEIAADHKVRLLRDDVVVFEGDIATLRRYKDEVRSVVAGVECGILLGGYSDIKEGDVIETYRLVEVEQQL